MTLRWPVGLVVVLLGAVAVGTARQPEAPAARTALETLQIENRDLKQRLTATAAEVAQWQAAFGTCAGQRGQLELAANRAALEAEDATLKTALEAARPGFTWDWKTQTFTPRSPDR